MIFRFYENEKEYVTKGNIVESLPELNSIKPDNEFLIYSNIKKITENNLLSGYRVYEVYLKSINEEENDCYKKEIGSYHDIKYLIKKD